VLLVTGNETGLGRNIAEAVLTSGDRLVATARDCLWFVYVLKLQAQSKRNHAWRAITAQTNAE
jgi:NAD(P)-dependent dehydrogenase (short-subunit alcohol dehydrogenase family)